LEKERGMLSKKRSSLGRPRPKTFKKANLGLNEGRGTESGKTIGPPQKAGDDFGERSQSKILRGGGIFLPKLAVI